MPTFAFTARDGAGQLVQGRRSAMSEAVLRRELKHEGVLLVRSKAAQGPKGAARLRRPKARELILFTFNMQNVLDSGVPILAGLDDLREETKDPLFRAVLTDLADRLNAGETFAQALGRHPVVFDQLYVSMVDAGEQSGRLPYVMERLVRMLEWREELRRSIRDMTSYPTVILVALIGLIMLVLGFVFPRFVAVFDRIQFELPWSTKVLIGASAFTQHYWWALILAAIGAAIGLAALRRNDSVRLFLDTWVMRMPIIGELVTMLNFSQVAKSLGSFLDAGIPIPRALELISRMVANRRVAKSVEDARDSILSGETLTDAFRAAGVFPPLVLRMVRMGEQSGRLVDSLSKAGGIYDREVPIRTKRVLDALSPVLTGVMGGILLFVVLSVLMPLYKMYQEIGTSY